jgi:DNA-binding GntR family transcriptional regulator
MAAQSNRTSENDRIGAICEALRRAIIEQALKPGTKLPEDTLGERFGVGRTIARQALAQLAAEGLVEHKRNRGAEVATPSWEEARDLFDLRLSLERVVVRRLAGHLKPEQIKFLKRHIAKEETSRNSREAISVRLATEFHTILAEMTGSPVITRYVQEICRRCGLTLTLYARPHSSDCAINEHIAIVDALAKGDANAAIHLMEHHLESVAKRALISPATPQTPNLMDMLSPYAEAANGNHSNGHSESAEPSPRKSNGKKAGHTKAVKRRAR